VTEGIEAALEQATEAAGGQDVAIAGGASVARQYLAAGLMDEIDLSIVPVLLGEGKGLFEGIAVDDIELEQLRAVDAPGVTHIKYPMSSAIVSAAKPRSLAESSSGAT
jgi:dihydrofolate reductase